VAIAIQAKLLQVRSREGRIVHKSHVHNDGERGLEASKRPSALASFFKAKSNLEKLSDNQLLH